MRYLRKQGDDPIRCYPYSEILAKRPDMFECDSEGRPLNSVDESAEELRRVTEELDGLRSSIEGMEVQSHQAALQAKEAMIEEQAQELEAKDTIIGDLQSKLKASESAANSPLSKLDIFLVSIEGLQPTEAKDALDSYVQNSFGENLDKRMTLPKMINAARDLAVKG
jgi:chromosome segregation ATPase